MAVRIGFDDDEELDLSKVSTKKQEDIINEVRKKTVYLSEKRAKEFLKTGYDCVVVNQFYNDDYHLSDEEKESKSAFYKEFVKYNKMKNTYRKLDEYVVKVRALLNCLDMVAENNGMYDPDKFKKMFFRGKITITGLKWPRFKGKEKKEISYDYLTEFILSDRDPKEILPSYDGGIDDIPQEQLFEEGELEKILSPLTEDELRLDGSFYDEDEDTYGTNVAYVLSKKERKMVNTPELECAIRDMKKRAKGRDILNSSYLHDITYSDIEEIAEYDQKYKFKSKDDIPEFKGDISNSKDYYKYMNKLEKYEKKHTKVNIGGKMKSLEEVEALELRALLEENGWDVRNSYEYKEKERKLKKLKKAGKRKEKELKEKLIRFRKKNNRKLDGKVEKELAKYEKKRKKKKEGKKDKKKRKNESSGGIKTNKDREKAKKRVMDGYDKVLLKSANRDEETFAEWEANVTDFTNI
jgi:hypothetical protein